MLIEDCLDQFIKDFLYKTSTFTPTYQFGQIYRFTQSQTFTNSDKFPSFVFSNSEVFSQTDFFTTSEIFSRSNVFLKTNDFSPYVPNRNSSHQFSRKQLYKKTIIPIPYVGVDDFGYLMCYGCYHLGGHVFCLIIVY